MKKRAIIALVLCLVMLLGTACGGVEVKDTTNQGAQNAGNTNNVAADTENEPIDITILCWTREEKEANIVRDMLTKQGFNVTINMQTDSSGYYTQLDAGNYDITVSSGGVPNGSPDYAVGTLFMSEGVDNHWGYSDPKIDELISTAASSDRSEWTDTYGALEDYLIDEITYQVPLYRQVKGRAVGSMLDADTTRVLSVWQDFSYNDASLNATRPMVHCTYGYSLATFDPIRADNSSIGTPANNLYIRIIDLNDDYTLTTNGTLTRNYAISADAQSYYFILRDDCFFTRVSADGEAVVSDTMVAGEDVVYSVNRMRDKTSVPVNSAYSNFINISDVSILTDVEELKNTVTAEGESVYDVLSKDLPAEIATLVESRDDVDNDAGNYQVVCIRTSKPFPQILNNLCYHGGGIVDSEWVEAINSKVDMEHYDANSDVLYADTNAMYEGANYANTISCSGPYVLTHIDDYGLYMVKNEGYYTDEGGANICGVTYLTMSDADSCLSALRSGEADYMWNLAVTQYSVVDSDENLTLCTDPGNRAYYICFNVNDPNSPCSDMNVRKAISASINQADFIAGMGYGLPSYSALSACLDCGRTFEYEEGLAQQYLAAYYDSLK